MKKSVVVLGIIFVLALATLALSQLDEAQPSSFVESITTEISENINLKEEQTCTTEFYDEIQPIYGTCTYYNNYTLCLNTTGPNTDCTAQQSTRQYGCQIGSTTLHLNKTTCTPNNEYIIETDETTKKIDYSDFGPCIQEEKDDCLIVTCVSYYDGAYKGQFTDCEGGKSCQRFTICEDGTKVEYKNSRSNFVDVDPTFHQQKIEIVEVG